MVDDAPITQWLRQLEAGNADAPRQLWQRYYRELVDLARARLGTSPRRVSDEEDVALSVMRCLFEGAPRGRFAALVNRQELWQLLATITGRKVIDRHRLLNQKKRGGGSIRGDSALLEDGVDSCGLGFDQFCGDVLPPEVLLIALEEYQRLMRLLDDDRLRQIAERKLEGYTNEDIAEQFGLTCRSIERKLQWIREIWAEELDR
jgi:DNA-directed RNA polymerase specialized sigma24 family protein